MKYKTYRIKVQPDSSKKIMAGKKLLGVIYGNSFRKDARGSRHLLRFVPGWAFDVDLLELLDEEGVEVIRLIDTETGTVYEASLNHFQDKAVPVRFAKFTSQLCLPLSAWKVI